MSIEIVILEFDSKVEEINEYFSFIEKTTHLRPSFSQGEEMVQVSQTVHNVLKANLFLLLYNLIESSFKDSLEKICIQISNEELQYQDLIPEIKKLWIEKEYKNFNSTNLPQNVKQHEYIMDKIDTIAEDIVNIEFYTDEAKTKNSDISGNLHVGEMSKIVSKYGAHIINKPQVNKSSLFTVKTQRNSLAHGEETFSECGGSYSLPKLKEIKDDSINYMQFILTHIENFINSQQYKKTGLNHKMERFGQLIKSNFRDVLY
ncbi:MAE_28990/MAE_18760 family HEPN-like nuclease [Sulfurimonas sp.]|uniref:MAE_28990/MAE_18760 family HEPN-like nuclease n=1 Tax=Sulfurimonas sp. TaxID=2022749 RepID=UPI0025DC3B9A|nr:MAE_28990/MAE_18760 family HEPN-like nuclease [Sulfurimonas sp.]